MTNTNEPQVGDIIQVPELGEGYFKVVLEEEGDLHLAKCTQQGDLL